MIQITKTQILRYFQHNFKLYPSYHHLEKTDEDTEFKCELLKDIQLFV